MALANFAARRNLTLGWVLASILSLGQAQALTGDVPLPQEMAVSYVGEGTRVSVGKANTGSLRGEVSQAFANDEKSAWIGEAWFGKQVGGVKLSRHWLHGEPDKDGLSVAKVFSAWDRNVLGDQKLTLGGGGENETFFWGGYGSFGLTGRRDAGQSISSKAETIFGSDPNLGDFTQQVTTTTTINTFEQAYNYGLGARLGRNYQPILVRLTAGLDHEWGHASSSQTTASLGLEKFFNNSPHSILLNLASAAKRGDFETDRHDHRVGVYWRYELGGKSGEQPLLLKNVNGSKSVPAASSLVATPVATPPPEKPPVAAPRVIATEILFDLGKSDLRPQARKELDSLLSGVPTNGAEYRLTVTGHTCDLGKTSYNQRLSEKRAAVVRDYLVSAGLAAERLTLDAKGESSPKYPNNRAERLKNRRCELELVITPLAIPDVQPVAAPGATPLVATLPVSALGHDESGQQPEWVRRAIYNPIRHKQEVDVYRTQERSVATSTGDRVYLNRPPVAVDDLVSWLDSARPIDVLANDSDPDSNPLRVVSVTAAAHGQVSIRADGKLDYLAQSGWGGGDQFAYTISDGKGGTASAKVIIAARINQPPVAVDDSISWLDGAKAIDVLANDSDPDGDPLRVISVTAGAHGQVSIRGDGKLDYLAQSGWVDGDQFTYTISDGKGGTASAKVTIAARLNRPPVAVNDSISWMGSQMPAIIDVLANDSDPDGDPISVISVINGSNGTVSIRPDGRLNYVVNRGWDGIDRFFYTISDGKGGTSSARVVIQIVDP